MKESRGQHPAKGLLKTSKATCDKNRHQLNHWFFMPICETIAI